METVSGWFGAKPQESSRADFARILMIFALTSSELGGVKRVIAGSVTTSSIPSRLTSTLMIEILLNTINVLHNTITLVWDENSATY